MSKNIVIIVIPQALLKQNKFLTDDDRGDAAMTVVTMPRKRR